MGGEDAAPGQRHKIDSQRFARALDDEFFKLRQSVRDEKPLIQHKRGLGRKNLAREGMPRERNAIDSHRATPAMPTMHDTLVVGINKRHLF